MFWRLTEDVAKGKWENKGVPADLKTEDHLQVCINEI
jgi:hypothetical protein